MKILGNRIYVDLPVIPEHKVVLDPKLKQQMEEEKLKEFDRLTVYAVGEAVKDVKVGDVVFVDPNELRKCTFCEIAGQKKAIVSYFGISHIWE